MTIRDDRRLLPSIIAIIAIALIQACQCDNSSSFDDAGTVSNRESESDVPDSDVLLDSEFFGEDSAMNKDTTSSERDAGGSSLVEAETRADSSVIPPNRIVSPDDLSVEMLNEYVDESTDWSELPELESESCGYSMTIVSSNTGTPQEEVRLFDEQGRLRLQNSEETITEVIYDKEGRPVTIWKKDRSLLSHKWADAIIVAIGYNSDGSAVSKAVFQHLMTTIIGGKGDCTYLGLNHNRRIEKFIRDQGCDNDADIEVVLDYSQNGKPLYYRRRDPGYDDIEIAWNYLDGGQQVKATWNDSRRGESVLYFYFNSGDKLVSICVDYGDDGAIDERTDYHYDDQGNMVKTETDLDRDGIIDLLRINSYNQNGMLVTRELRNLVPPGIMVQIPNSEFENIETTASKTTTYTYDDEFKPVEIVTESRFTKGELRRVVETFRYDDLHRLIEQRIASDYLDGSLATGAPDIIQETTCTFEYPCDTRFDESSPLRRCEFGTPVHNFLFPYNTVREIPFHSNRTIELTLEVDVDPEDALGIPWY